MRKQPRRGRRCNFFRVLDGPCRTAGAGAEIAAIRTEIAALMARLERLEQAAAAGSAGSPPPPAPLPPPAAAEARVAQRSPPAVRFSGDLRYRHETINEAGEVERNGSACAHGSASRPTSPQNVRVGLQLATGGDDPVSANQTLDTGFNRKSIGVDRAFFTWAATEQLTFTGGKIANPFFRPGNHHLIYDNDLNPEGLALRYSRGDWFANYAGLWVEERSAATIRSCSADSSATAHARQRHAYNGRSELLRLPRNAGSHTVLGRRAVGNRLALAGGYLNDFNLTELFAELRLEGRRAAADGVRRLRRQQRSERRRHGLRARREPRAKCRAPARGASATRIKISRPTP